MLENDGERFFPVLAHTPCRAEVEELHRAVHIYHEIGGADVAVDKPRLMNMVKRNHNRAKYFIKLVKVADAPVLAEILPETYTLYVFHDDIYGVVFGKEV